jgi:hypothetical protein
VFGIITVSLLLVLLFSTSVGGSILCLALENSSSDGTPSRMSTSDEECTCKMSPAQQGLASSAPWAVAIDRLAQSSLDQTLLNLAPTTPTWPRSFDTIIPTPPPKA